MDQHTEGGNKQVNVALLSIEEFSASQQKELSAISDPNAGTVSGI